MIKEIKDIKTFAYGEKEYNPPTIPSFNQGSTSIPVKMYYNGNCEYDDLYHLDIGENPSLSFTYYDTINNTTISGMNTTLGYSNLDTSKAGYYFNEYIADDGYGGLYNIYFRIVFKVGEPQGIIQSPEEHIRYYYEGVWKDQLTGYGKIEYINDVAQPGDIIQDFQYDSIGNPTTITNFKYNGSVYHHANLVYDGRQLKSIKIYNTDTEVETSLVATILYQYNDQGIRTKEQIITSESTTTTEYFIDGDKVLQEKLSNGTILDYFYDVDGTLTGFKCDDNIYLYIRNIQGDITRIVDESGNIVVEYSYDAWGNILKKNVNMDFINLLI